MSIKDELEVMKKRCADLEAELAEKEDMRPYALRLKRIGKTNKFLFVDSDRNFSAQFIKRDNDNYVSTAEYVHSEEETNSNEDVQSIIAHKKKCDELASRSEVF